MARVAVGGGEVDGDGASELGSAADEIQEGEAANGLGGHQVD